MIIKHKETHMTIARTFQRAALVMRKNSPLTNSKSQLSDKKTYRIRSALRLQTWQTKLLRRYISAVPKWSMVRRYRRTRVISSHTSVESRNRREKQRLRCMAQEWLLGGEPYVHKKIFTVSFVAQTWQIVPNEFCHSCMLSCTYVHA